MRTCIDPPGSTADFICQGNYEEKGSATLTSTWSGTGNLFRPLAGENPLDGKPWFKTTVLFNSGQQNEIVVQLLNAACSGDVTSTSIGSSARPNGTCREITESTRRATRSTSGSRSISTRTRTSSVAN